MHAILPKLDFYSCTSVYTNLSNSIREAQTMDITDRNKVVLVTGSAQGLGNDIAHSLAGGAQKIALHGLTSQQEGDLLASQIADQHGIECAFFNHDLSSPDNAAQLVEAVIERFGDISVLVNNAGIQHSSDLLSFNGQAFEQVINVNLIAVFYATQAAARHMVKRGYGRIINVSSVHGQVASKNKSAYVASKHGVLGLTKAAALELAGTGVTVNAVCPGWVDTDIFRNQVRLLSIELGISEQQARKQLVSEKQPLNLTTAPSSIGAMIHFMIGENSDTLTGAAWNMDGGWLAQ